MNFTAIHHAFISALALFVCSIPSANAYNFIPEEHEFNTWPRYCQAIYASIGIEKKYARRIPLNEQKRWKKWADPSGAWHYCASTVWINRAKVEMDPRVRKFNYERAIANAKYSYVHCPKSQPIRAKMGTTLARAYKGIGDVGLAIEYLKEVMVDHPDYPGSYQLMSLILRDAGQLKESLDILLKGNEATGGDSAELHYFLGLAYLMLDDVKSAKKHADKAYTLGYPLPGLRNKLKKKGVYSSK
ncbi:MAG: hypothetical protein ABW078_05545 [Sedimenticola sp.]